MGVSLMTDQEIVKKVGSYVEVHLPEWIKSARSGGLPENLDSAGSAGDDQEAAGKPRGLTTGPDERTGKLEETTNNLIMFTIEIVDALKKQGDLIVSLTERTGGLEEVTKKLAERTEELSGRMIRVEEAIAGFTQGMSDFRVEMKQQGKRIDVMNERLTQLEESNKNQNERLIQLEESNRNQVNLVEKLLHQMDKRFEQTDKRFEEVHKRFGQLITAVVAGFGVIGGLVTIYKFFG